MSNINGRLEKETQFYEKMKTKLKNMPKILNEYYTSMRANRKSYTTIGVYINNVIHFASFVCNGNIAEDFYKYIGPSDVESYMISLETRQTKHGIQRMGDDILQSRWSSLNTFFEWLMQRNYITNNPIRVVSRPKNNTEHKVSYLTKAEIGKLFRAVDINSNRVAAMRDRALFSLAIATGMRASALLNINIDDIDFNSGFIRVIEKRQKTREIPIGQNTMSVLQDWIEVRNEEFDDLDIPAVFVSQKGGRLSPDAANDSLRKYCSMAGIHKKITMHKLRATSACSLAKAGLPLKAIQRQLGHASSQTTLIYIDVFNEDMDKARTILDDLF